MIVCPHQSGEVDEWSRAADTQRLPGLARATPFGCAARTRITSRVVCVGVNWPRGEKTVPFRSSANHIRLRDGQGRLRSAAQDVSLAKGWKHHDVPGV